MLWAALCLNCSVLKEINVLQLFTLFLWAGFPRKAKYLDVYGLLLWMIAPGYTELQVLEIIFLSYSRHLMNIPVWPHIAIKKGNKYISFYQYRPAPCQLIDCFLHVWKSGSSNIQDLWRKYKINSNLNKTKFYHSKFSCINNVIILLSSRRS